MDAIAFVYQSDQLQKKKNNTDLIVWAQILSKIEFR